MLPIVSAIRPMLVQAMSLPSSLAVASQPLEGFKVGQNPATVGSGVTRDMGSRVELPTRWKQSDSKKDTTAGRTLRKDTRRAFIQKAQVWTPTSVSEMDLRTGPEGTGAFQPNETVKCEYVMKSRLPGSTRKFYCDVGDGDVVKVR